jgi:hypothetical protein
MGKTVWTWLPSLYIDIPALRPGTIGAYAFVVVTVAIAPARS